jgi:hypothetical protein
MKTLVAALLLLGTATAIGQQADGTDPNFWCNVSRSQVSAERDAGLAQIEKMKLASAQVSRERDAALAQVAELRAANEQFAARIKVLETPAEPESK